MLICIYLDHGDLYDKLFILLNTMIRKYDSFLNSLQLPSFSYDAVQIPLHMFPNMKITAEIFQSLIFDDFDDMGVVSKEKVQKIIGFKLKNMWEKNNIEKEQEQSRPTVQSLTKQIVGANLCI